MLSSKRKQEDDDNEAASKRGDCIQRDDPGRVPRILCEWLVGRVKTTWKSNIDDDFGDMYREVQIVSGATQALFKAGKKTLYMWRMDSLRE